MNDLDPDHAASLDELAAYLRQLHLRADKPSYRMLEARTRREGGYLPGTQLHRVPLGRSAIAEMLAGRDFPRKAFLLTFVEACGVDLDTDRRWERAWDRIAAGMQTPADVKPVQQGRKRTAARAGPTLASAIPDASGFDLCPDPLTVKTPEELVEALRQFRIWAGEPSFRTMERLSSGAVAASTMCTALRSNSLPRLPVVLAIVTACGGSDEQRQAFTTAWRMLRAAKGNGGSA